MEVEESELRIILSSRGYQVVSSVGRGTYGCVYLVYSEKYREQFCIKIVKATHASIQEIDTLKSLAHPNIIRIYDYFTVGENLHIVLEYCPNGSLAEIIHRKGCIDKHDMPFMMIQLLNAIEYCHQNQIVHRDIKPSNILIDRWGRLKLTDFGLSTFTIESAHDNKATGSLNYMAPEIIRGNNYDMYKADIWALGITFYKMACGSLPWPNCSIQELKGMIISGMICFPLNFPNKFVKIIKKMLTFSPSKRILPITQVNSILDRERTRKRKTSLLSKACIKSAKSYSNGASLQILPKTETNIPLKNKMHCVLFIPQLNGTRANLLSSSVSLDILQNMNVDSGS